jgi:hypothetical protein
MVVAPELYPLKQSRMVRKYGAAIREAAGVDPAMIADSLGIKPITVVTIQRKLGLRACRPPGRQRFE